ncbi:MAG: glutamine-hydrolyzing carbamoyl-phosphate synthase small subunit [Phycisphaerales bacterium]|nr:glutamine-hydrolyzing carbamoyl-phosphate synthase small subunit [Phycisphaerales bacterium]
MHNSTGPSGGSGGQAAGENAGRLALADGSVHRGRAFGAVSRGVVSVGEVVFNTAMSGYQESLTDPSYTGQILVETFPLIGNTGVNEEDVESGKVQVAGFVVRELARRHSNYRADLDLPAYLAKHGVLGLEGIDTRAITKRLRTGGAMSGVLTDRADLSDAELVEMARRAPSMAGQNLVPMVACSAKEKWTEGMGDWPASGTGTPRRGVPPSEVSGTDTPRRGVPPRTARRYRVLAFDCGAKRNILRNLTDRGCDVTVVPFDTPAAEVKRLYAGGEIDGVFVSNGPGDPAAVEGTIRTLRELIEPGAPAIPTFGICLGHQLLSLAAGAKTYKLPFGHRGINQPVLNKDSRRVEITSQNHGFAVEPASLEAAGGEITHLHLNDGTVAGFRLKGRPVFSVQYHPEASPGPHDAGYLFDAFVESMAAGRVGVGGRR